MENEFNFKPFDKVLVRDSHIEHWEISFYSRYIGENNEFPHKCTGSCYKYCIPYNNETAHLLGTTDDYVEPWQPKDGDFIAIEETFPNGDKAKWICVFNTFEEFKICFHIGLDSDFVLMRGGGEGWYYRDHTESFRSATEEERQLLLSQLHEAGKDWNAEKKKIVEYRWRPKEKEYYWTIYGDGRIDRICKATESDAMHIKIGNCFRTEAEAQAMANKVKELFQRK